MNVLQQLPAIGAYLAGPVGTLAGSAIEWLADKFGASEKTVESIKQTIAGMSPDQLLQAKKLDIEFQEFCAQNAIAIPLAQIAVNVEEAKSESLFIAGGRPACIWIGAFALAYASIIEPLMRFVAVVMFKYGGSFPAIDTDITLQVLFGLLGLGALRSVDKFTTSRKAQP